MNWLVTGGAGYIGAHVLRALIHSGSRPVVLDDFSTGTTDVVPPEVPIVRATVLDTDAVSRALEELQVEGVVHLAAKKSPGHSIHDPLHYYRENVGGLTSVLEAMRRAGVDKLVLSSSSSVYGTAGRMPISEDVNLCPESPYGETKVVAEWLVKASAQAYGLRYIILRYFNVAGAGRRGLHDRGTANLIPIVLQSLRNKRNPTVYGADYPTPDGSCIRDYVHVVDLAEAHAAAATQMVAGRTNGTYNVGTGVGSSVLDVLDVIRSTVGIDFQTEVGARRPGDPACVIGDVAAIRRDLQWSSRLDLRQMIESAWEAGNMSGALE